jgi:hypothetical protein
MRYARSTIVLWWCAGIVATTMLAPIAAQITTVPGTPPPNWRPSRTPDGHPDLQGTWANNTVTPFERPTELNGREFVTDAELRMFQERAARLFNGTGDIAPGDELFSSLLANPDQHTSKHSAVGDYNQVWDADELVFEYRTSQMLEPATGLLPAMTATGRQRQSDVRDARRLHGTDGPEARTGLERCITNGAIKMGFVQTRYNSYYEIVQTHDYVVLHNELVHEARIIPLSDRPHAPTAIRSWLGDSRGRWDGDTLVIDTTNFSAQSTFRPTLSVIIPAEQFHVVERLTRSDANYLRYEVTVNDPATWVGPWKAVTTWKRSTAPMYEFACHEGNYGMEGLLRGARADERAADLSKK